MRVSRVLAALGAVAIVVLAAVWWFVAEDLRRVRGVIRAASATEMPELAGAALVAAEGTASFTPQLVKNQVRGHGLGRVFREMCMPVLGNSPRAVERWHLVLRRMWNAGVPPAGSAASRRRSGIQGGGTPPGQPARTPAVH